MAEWKGVPYFFNFSEDLSYKVSVLIDKIPLVSTDATFAWDVVVGAAVSGLVGGSIPAFIAWLAIQNSRRDSERNRAATINATKQTIYGQAISENIRKKSDLIITLTSHFITYCIELILNENKIVTNKFDYSKTRVELVLIFNKLKLLIGNNGRGAGYDVVLKLNRLLDDVENYYKNVYKNDEVNCISCKEIIESETNILTELVNKYISNLESELKKNFE